MKIILEINFFLLLLGKFTVEGFVNQLIKNSGLTYCVFQVLAAAASRKMC